MNTWAALGKAPEPYEAGTPGPAVARDLITRDGRAWIEDH